MLIILLLVSITAHTQVAEDLVLTDAPQRFQLFPRDGDNSAVVRLAGTSLNERYDSVFTIITQNGEFFERQSQPLTYTNEVAHFEFLPKIDGSNPFSARLFPNPNSDVLSAEFLIPYNGNIYLTITDVSGHIIKEKQFHHIDKKNATVEIVKKDELQMGVYFFHWVFDDKYAYDNKAVITE